MISVVVATYRPDMVHLSMQIDSILTQSRPVDEIILRDDASGLEFADRLQALAATDPRISLTLSQTNLGYAGNFTEGLCLASGEIVFFSDQDDVWHDDKVEKVSVAFEMTKGLLVYHDQNRVFPDLKPKHSTTAELYTQQGRPGAFVHGCATAITSAFKPIALSRPDKFAHDDWMHAVARRLGRSVFLDDSLMEYRIHPASASRNKPPADADACRLAQRLRFRERFLSQALDANTAAIAALSEPELWRDVAPDEGLQKSLAQEKAALEAEHRLLRCGLAELPLVWPSAMMRHGLDGASQLESLKDVIARLAAAGAGVRT